MPEQQFTVSYGITGGSKQITFYYCAGVNLAQFLKAIEAEFPGMPFEKLNVLPGISCTVTTGKDLEIPKN